MAGHGKIVIIDHDAAVRESACFLLEVAGHSAVAYASGTEFLEQCNINDVTGLILDHHMPQMSGLDVAARLHSEGKRVPILLITSSPSAAIIARARDLGVKHVLEKPPSEEDLFTFINSIVTHSIDGDEAERMA
jgi:two-component system, LuxR family, response regulator FixJ